MGIEDRRYMKKRFNHGKGYLIPSKRKSRWSNPWNIFALVLLGLFILSLIC